MTEPRLIRMLVEYDGAPYCGWQRQAGLPTVQGALEAALHHITHEPAAALDVRAAGRTDAGVHALGQVVTFHTVSALVARRFAPALNHHLPHSIRVHKTEAAAATFSARHDAAAKTYSYTLYQGGQPSALLHQRAWHIRRHLDVAAMQRGARHLVGAHDFESFRSAHCDAPHARRELFRLHIGAPSPHGAGQTVQVTLEGDAFCRHMCRILVGTLVQVGSHRRAPDELLNILLARDRTRAGETAPGVGLTLERVHYPQALQVLGGG